MYNFEFMVKYEFLNFTVKYDFFYQGQFLLLIQRSPVSHVTTVTQNSYPKLGYFSAGSHFS